MLGVCYRLENPPVFSTEVAQDDCEDDGDGEDQGDEGDQVDGEEGEEEEGCQFH